jgi:hypothetical protein
MAKVSMLTNDGQRFTLSAEAHCPHYLGRASYLDQQPVIDAQARALGFSETCLRYRFSGTPWPPLAFVQLVAGIGYAVRAVVASGTNQWDIFIGTTSTSGPIPSVFCFNRISGFVAGGPALRLRDAAGNPSFDSRQRPIRFAGILDFAAYGPNTPTGTQSLALPSGMTRPAVSAPCPGFGQLSAAVGAYYRVSAYRAYWMLSGSNLMRAMSFVGQESGLEPVPLTTGSYSQRTTPVIETYGLP